MQPSPDRPESRPDHTPESDLYAHFRHAAEEESGIPPARRPWLLAALALLCAALVIAGGFGPWFFIPTPAPHTLYGAQTDGAVAIVAAVAAAVTLLIALPRTGASPFAWASLLAFVICLLTGLASWLALAPASSGTGVETRWGVAVVTFAGLAGAICALTIARRLKRY